MLTWAIKAKLLGVVGQHPDHHLIRADLADCQVAIADLNPNSSEPPPVFSIIVTQATGERAVVSLSARSQAASASIPAGILQGVKLSSPKLKCKTLFPSREVYSAVYNFVL